MNLPEPWQLDALDRANRKKQPAPATFTVREGDELACTTCGRTFVWTGRGQTRKAGLGCLVLLAAISLIGVGVLTLAGGVGIIPLILGIVLAGIAKHMAARPDVVCPHCGATGGFHPADSPAGQAYLASLRNTDCELPGTTSRIIDGHLSNE